MLSLLALTVLLQQSPAPQPSPLPAPDPPPFVGEWVVHVIGNIEVLPESRITMRILGSARPGSGLISGAASCNTYRGDFTITGATVQMGALLRTMMACDPARMSEEQDFFALLGDVVRVEQQSDGTLVLTTGAGKTIRARRP